MWAVSKFGCGSTTQHSTLSSISLAPAGTVGLAPTCISLLSCAHAACTRKPACWHSHVARRTHSLSLSLSLSSCICAPCKTSVWESTSRSTERAVGRGRRRSPSPQYRVPIQVVRRERSGVITTRGGRLLTSASEQKQQDVKMGIELGSGLGSQRQRRGGNHSPTPEMRGGSLRTSIGGSE